MEKEHASGTMYPEDGVEVFAQFEPRHKLDAKVQNVIVYRKNGRWYPDGGFPILEKNIGWTPLTSIRLMYKGEDE